jgi:hypothetical protein
MERRRKVLVLSLMKKGRNKLTSNGVWWGVSYAKDLSISIP